MAERKQTKKSGKTRAKGATRSASRPKNVVAPSSGRGAVRKKGGNKSVLSGIRWSLLFKVTSLVTLLAVGIWKIDWQGVSDRVQAHVNKPVASVSVKGEFTHLSRLELQQLVMAELEGNFMQVDIESLRASLHQNPWVQNVSVQRVWPDGLSIEVQEQKPIARWNAEGFINNVGQVITIGDNSKLHHLPRLAGPLDQSALITRTYQDMTEMLASRNMRLSAIHVDATHAWRVQLDNNIEIVFGQYDVLTKLRNFLLVFDKKLRSVSDKIERVDMRYDSGMAVAWIDQGGNGLQASR